MYGVPRLDPDSDSDPDPDPDSDSDSDPSPEVDTGLDADEGWRFYASRICPACRGTGQPPRSNPADPHTPGTRALCPTCDGQKRLTESFDIARLRALLASQWPRPDRD
jgi:hypothetical protein